MTSLTNCLISYKSFRLKVLEFQIKKIIFLSFEVESLFRIKKLVLDFFHVISKNVLYPAFRKRGQAVFPKLILENHRHKYLGVHFDIQMFDERLFFPLKMNYKFITIMFGLF